MSEIWVNPGSDNGLSPDNQKPLPEQMLSSKVFCGIHPRTISQRVCKPRFNEFKNKRLTFLSHPPGDNEPRSMNALNMNLIHSVMLMSLRGLQAGRWMDGLRKQWGTNQQPLTHWSQDKMAANFQTAFSHAFTWMKMYEFPLRFHKKFVPKGVINNIPALVHIMAWHGPGDKPLSEPMMVTLRMHICVNRPQWVYKGPNMNMYAARCDTQNISKRKVI